MMVKMIKILVFFVVSSLISVIPMIAQTVNASINIDAANPGINLSPDLYGIFFEEINHAGDGGLYAELIKNRSFEDNSSTPADWTMITTGGSSGSISLDTTNLLNSAQSRSLKLTVSNVSLGGKIGLANSGYWGINITNKTNYQLSFYARVNDNAFNGALTASLENNDGTIVYASSAITGLTTQWKKFTAVLKATGENPAGRFVLTTQTPGIIWLDVVSLFPPTYKNSANGLRIDLANMVNGLKPRFNRFPGGCYVEGDYLANRFIWKNSIGDIANRPGHLNAIWNYRSTDGLGYHEYLQMCEDINADGLFVINCGISHNDTVPESQIDTYVQDALDAIEYAIGPSSSTWGARRSANGHPAPFNLKYIEIGNENNFQLEEYEKRYHYFYSAIKAKYPNLILVADCNLTNGPVDYIDEHYYKNPQWFIDNYNLYDGYSRTGPKIYVGEYACTSGCGNGNLIAALGEGVFMMGMEKNSDIVRMSSYAPLFVNVNDRRWNPDMICFNSATTYGTPSYYTQKLFSNNYANINLKTSVNQESNITITGAIGVGTWETQADYDNVIVTADGSTLFSDDFSGGASKWTPSGGTWSAVNNVYTQTSTSTDCRSTAANIGTTAYTYSLRAKKNSGNEGFLIMFGAKNSTNFYWWNLGGWGNTKYAIERAINGSKKNLAETTGSISTGVWYDIRIEIDGAHIKCYLNNSLIHDIIDTIDTAFNITGQIGVGTWKTQSDYDDISVTTGSTTLFSENFSNGASRWTPRIGTWSVSGGVYSQTSNNENCQSVAANITAASYTYSLRARKNSGSEGFLIMFGGVDSTNYYWWNLGGWSNTKHAIEKFVGGGSTVLTEAAGSITTGQWYDIRIVVNGSRIQCYLNNTLIHDITDYNIGKEVFSIAGKENSTGDIIVKIINTGKASKNTNIKINGVASIEPVGTVTTLSSGSLMDENSIADPLKIIPITRDLTGLTTDFNYSVPAYSIVILRLKTNAAATLINPYQQIEAEDYQDMQGISLEPCQEGGLDVKQIDNGDYLVFNRLDFGTTGAAQFESRVASGGTGGQIEIRLDSVNGPLMGTCSISNTGGYQTWETVSCNLNKITGIHNLYLVFTGNTNLFNFNNFTFSLTAEYSSGDVNHDNVVNIIDALLIAQYTVQLNPAGFYPEQGDINNDGNIDIIDALIIAQISVGL